MKRISLGDQVRFTTNTGQSMIGTVVDLITERRQPTMVLIERPDSGRAIRLENDVQRLELAEIG
ncbi:MAG TPA: hypothetical protein VFT74_09305 [Isosphaeraceae bacterium]|nr:hypothetical protein [Isosphaeraceae bacterium]